MPNFQSSINRLLSTFAGAGFVGKNRDKLAFNDNIQKQEEAKSKVKQIQEAKKTQRRNFMDYLAKQPTSLGGTIGELPKSMQKQIASQYSKSQRKAMMDKMDKEAKNGKQ